MPAGETWTLEPMSIRLALFFMFCSSHGMPYFGANDPCSAAFVQLLCNQNWPAKKTCILIVLVNITYAVEI